MPFIRSVTTRIPVSFAVVCLYSTALLGEGVWTPVAPLPAARSQMAVTAGPDGRIYALGGLVTVPTPYIPVGTVQTYDPVTNAWSTVAAMPTARYNFAAVSVGGLVYAIGGYNGGPLNTNEVYNPATGTWASLAPMPTPRHDLVAVMGSNGRIYAIGGSTDGGGTSTSAAEVYDPISNIWTTVNSMPTSRLGPGAGMGNDGLIYVFGGVTQPGTTLRNSVEAYDPVANVWTTKTSMPTARSTISTTVAPDGTIYAMGGQTLTTTLNTVEAFNPSTNTWANATPMPMARAAGGAALGSNGKIYLVGGYSISGGAYVLDSAVEAFSNATSVLNNSTVTKDILFPTSTSVTLSQQVLVTSPFPEVTCPGNNTGGVFAAPLATRHRSAFRTALSF